MGWKFPRRLPRANQVVDYRDFNDAFLPFAEEDGRLNEHNWSLDMASQLDRVDDLTDDVSFRTHVISKELDASGTYNGAPTLPDFIDADTGWTIIPELTYTFSTGGGTLYVLASIQTGNAAIATTALVYTRLAIRLNGTVLPISVVGDQDFYASGATMETGISSRLMGVDIDHSFPLPPGKHTVDIVADVKSINKTDSDLRAAFYNREMLLWEIR
jgi:hypothetical protein